MLKKLLYQEIHGEGVDRTVELGVSNFHSCSTWARICFSSPTWLPLRPIPIPHHRANQYSPSLHAQYRHQHRSNNCPLAYLLTMLASIQIPAHMYTLHTYLHTDIRTVPFLPTSEFIQTSEGPMYVCMYLSISLVFPCLPRSLLCCAVLHIRILFTQFIPFSSAHVTLGSVLSIGHGEPANRRSKAPPQFPSLPLNHRMPINPSTHPNSMPSPTHILSFPTIIPPHLPVRHVPFQPSSSHATATRSQMAQARAPLRPVTPPTGRLTIGSESRLRHQLYVDPCCGVDMLVAFFALEARRVCDWWASGRERRMGTGVWDGARFWSLRVCWGELRVHEMDGGVEWYS
ncbi:hypothetical protein P154DRAFT_326723 [Amniculicola lignicola CBS 123094]|uniref:Uncharacterized protein n=1 Tax=Amniculicola lignicola CBS 123094 TaxID=1392246 RepID=A0A6A5W2W9_9PLEO|nr:hypothetical protein P154DRAFT_326723 [Amniculicola lignicola CBS 123094]